MYAQATGALVQRVPESLAGRIDVAHRFFAGGLRMQGCCACSPGVSMPPRAPTLDPLRMCRRHSLSRPFLLIPARSTVTTCQKAHCCSSLAEGQLLRFPASRSIPASV